jgi:hypothetical protein
MRAAVMRAQGPPDVLKVGLARRHQRDQGGAAGTAQAVHGVFAGGAARTVPYGNEAPLRGDVPKRAARTGAAAAVAAAPVEALLQQQSGACAAAYSSPAAAASTSRGRRVPGELRARRPGRPLPTPVPGIAVLPTHVLPPQVEADFPKPQRKAGEVLIQVAAASVNPIDVKVWCSSVQVHVRWHAH